MASQEAMGRLVDSCTVQGHLGEQVANPVLQRFNRAVALRALQSLTPGAPQSEASCLVECVGGQGVGTGHKTGSECRLQRERCNIARLRVLAEHRRTEPVERMHSSL